MLKLYSFKINDKLEIPFFNFNFQRIDFYIKSKNIDEFKLHNLQNLFFFNSLFSNFFENNIKVLFRIISINEKIKLDRLLEISNKNFNLMLFFNHHFLTKNILFVDKNNQYKIKILNPLFLQFLKRFPIISFKFSLYSEKIYCNIITSFEDNIITIENKENNLPTIENNTIIYSTFSFPYIIQDINELYFKNKKYYLSKLVYESEIRLSLKIYNPVNKVIKKIEKIVIYLLPKEYTQVFTFYIPTFEAEFFDY